MGKNEDFLPRIEPGAHEARSSSGLTVYYPFELVKFLGFFEDDETRAAGELLMSFLDSGGCRVTLRAKRSAVGTLLGAHLQESPPDHARADDELRLLRTLVGDCLELAFELRARTQKLEGQGSAPDAG